MVCSRSGPRETILMGTPSCSSRDVYKRQLLAMGGGVVLSKSMRLNRKEQHTLIIEIGMQNAAQAISVASSPFVFNNDIIAIPAIIYARNGKWKVENKPIYQV